MYNRGTKVIARGSAGEVDSVYSNVNGVYYEVVFRQSEDGDYSRKDTRGWFKASEVKAVSRYEEAYYNARYATEKLCIEEAADLFYLYNCDEHEVLSTWGEDKTDAFILKVANALFDGDIVNAEYTRYIFENVLEDYLREESKND